MALKEFTAIGATVSSNVLNTDAYPDTWPTIVNPATAGSIAYVNTNTHAGIGWRAPAISTASEVYTMRMSDALTTNTAFAIRCYIYVATSLPSTTVPLGPQVATSSDGNLARTQVSATGQVQIVMGGTTGSFSAGTFAVNTLYRWELVTLGLNGASGSATCNLYVGDSLTPSVSATVSGATTAATAARGRLLKNSSATVGAITFSDYAQNGGATAEIGPRSTSDPGWTYGRDVRIG